GKLTPTRLQKETIMTNALIKTMRDKLGDMLTKEVIYQGCVFMESKYRTKLLILKKYAKNNAEIAEEIKKLKAMFENLEEIEESLLK
ncbi:MAG: hypothetical protein ACLSF0_13390, partial [Hominilimicola sp.]|uniref:hypothetical protein n=1 Tax=Hominilimicola sp. TaxID=3073571 RepID=UPI00399458F1